MPEGEAARHDRDPSDEASEQRPKHATASDRIIRMEGDGELARRVTAL